MEVHVLGDLDVVCVAVPERLKEMDRLVGTGQQLPCSDRTNALIQRLVNV